MSRFRWSDIRDAVFPASGSARTIINSGSGKLKAFGTAIPPDGIAGYARGGIFIDTTNGRVYENAGSNTSANFDELLIPSRLSAAILSDVQNQGTAAGRGPSPLLWANCPQLEYMLNPQLGSHYFEDFKGDIYGIAGGTNRMKGLTFFEATGCTHEAVDDDVHGVLRAEGNNDDNADSIVAYGHDGGVIVPTVGKKFWFEARVRRDTVSDNTLAMFIGLAEEGLAAVNSLDVDSGDLVTGKDWLGFHSDQADGNAIDFVHGDGTGEAVVKKAGIVVPTASAWNKVGFYCDGTTVLPYIDGVAQTADGVLLAASDMPLGEELGIYFMLKNGATTTEHKGSIDWWSLSVEY
jgi:hypothetical protein